MAKETKDLTVRPGSDIVAVGNQIDSIIKECLPVTLQGDQNFVQALTIANGIKALRQIFRTNPQIRETVEAMQNTNLGFMTDRTPAAINKSEGKLKAYTYEEISECCIEAMLQGFRMTNNEFNVIATRFYPAKNGKFRRIIETPGVTDFKFTTTSPIYDSGHERVEYAKVQAYASWRKDGQLATLGSSTKTEDRLIFKIRVNKFMGEDAIVGKALSKLFSRVLLRIEGKIMPESTDVVDDDFVEGETAEPDLSEKLKAGQEGTAQELYGQNGKADKPKDPQPEASEQTTEVKSEAQPDVMEAKKTNGDNGDPSTRGQKEVLKGLMKVEGLTEAEMRRLYEFGMGKRPTKQSADHFIKNFDAIFANFREREDKATAKAAEKKEGETPKGETLE